MGVRDWRWADRLEPIVESKNAGSFGDVYVKGLLGFGKPGRQRFSMQYGYSARRSWWQELKAHAHLVIAAVGTMALLAVAAIAFWLAMPTGERQAFAEAKVDPQPAIATGVTTPVPADGTGITAEQPASQPETPVATASVAQQPETTLTQPKIPELDPQAAAAIAVPAVDDVDAEPSADAKQDGANPDGPVFAAIPTPRPTLPGETEENRAADSNAADDKASGHVLRAVTMRSGPKTGAAAIGTVPAKTAVEVLSCEKWCEIVYKGKRGFVYKSFVQRD